MDQEILREAIRCLIESEGNKLKAIKDLMAYTGISQEDAIDYVDIADDEINKYNSSNRVIEEEEIIEEFVPVEKKPTWLEGRKIEYTRIIDRESEKDAGSVIIRGAIGGLIAGPAGAIIGGLTGKNNNYTTFQIVYRNGKSRTETVKNNSPEYRKYCKYLID